MTQQVYLENFSNMTMLALYTLGWELFFQLTSPYIPLAPKLVKALTSNPTCHKAKSAIRIHQWFIYDGIMSFISLILFFTIPYIRTDEPQWDAPSSPIELHLCLFITSCYTMDSIHGAIYNYHTMEDIIHHSSLLINM